MTVIADGELDPGLLPDEPDEDEIKPYIFTFGSGHRLVITPAYGGQPQGAGIPLDRHYIVIAGTWESSRERFIELFGTSFASQYPSAADAGVDDWGLTRLELPGLLP